MDLIKKFYGSGDETNSEEEFEGFDLDNGSHEHFSCGKNSLEIENSDLPIDSDGSFFDDGGESHGEPRPKRGKRTKKEIQKLQSADKRRNAHGIKLIDCGCTKECTGLVTKDDRSAVHREFWALDVAGQRSYIRERVVRKPVTRRVRYRSPNNPIKMHSYTFHIRPIGSNEFIRVCRKFFMNTIGYSTQCG